MFRIYLQIHYFHSSISGEFLFDWLIFPSAGKQGNVHCTVAMTATVGGLT